MCTVASAGAFSAVTWLAIMPSVIGRRPKGVVAVCVCIVLHLARAKEIQPPEAEHASKGLTVIRGSEILALPHYEKGFRNSLLGAFFLCRSVSVGLRLVTLTKLLVKSIEMLGQVVSERSRVGSLGFESQNELLPITGRFGRQAAIGWCPACFAWRGAW